MEITEPTDQNDDIPVIRRGKASEEIIQRQSLQKHESISQQQCSQFRPRQQDMTPTCSSYGWDAKIAATIYNVTIQSDWPSTSN